jgi:hypothetical protein
MPISITLATQINSLIGYLLGPLHDYSRSVSSEDAAHAAAQLADQAGKALGAGWHGEQVKERWAKQRAGTIVRYRATPPEAGATGELLWTDGHRSLVRLNLSEGRLILYANDELEEIK